CPLPSALIPLPSSLIPFPSALIPFPSSLIPFPSSLFPSLPTLIPFVAASLLLSSCSAPRPSPDQPAVIWQHVGSWSGRGDVETESFPGSSGYFRFTWETSGETKP